MSAWGPLDAAALTMSLFNTMLLTWLGLTIFLTSERRSPGILLTTAGLLFGASFFVAHSVILAQVFSAPTRWLNIWWHLGWLPVSISPFLWYVVVLWYAGFWEQGENPLRRRQSPFLGLTGIFGLTIILLLLTGRVIPSFFEVIRFDLTHTTAVGGLPILVVIFPIYLLTCLGLALDALFRPGPVRRLLGGQARTRARPWLLGSSLLLLIVSILVALTLAWIVSSSSSVDSYLEMRHIATRLTVLDLIIASLVGLAVIFLGQALVSYEIFTGKVLPRQSLRRQFRNAVLLFGGSSLLVSGVYVLHLSPIYGLMLALLVTSVFFALLTWRTFNERDWTIRQLRPFVSSQRLYDRLFGSTPVSIETSFSTLCTSLLEANAAAIVPLGPLAALAPQPLVYPTRSQPNLAFAEGLKSQFTPDRLVVTLDPDVSAGFILAAPLWSERGLTGVLFLSEKIGGGFYSLEEIEIARASSERLVDQRASAEINRRLAALQREQVTASQVIDRRTRRALHDDVLPILHTGLLRLSASSAATTPEVTGVIQDLAQAHRQISALLREIPNAPAPEVNRMGLLAALRQMAEEEFGRLFDEVIWEEDEAAAAAAASLPPLAAEVFYYACREAVRNAGRYARGEGDLTLRLSISGKQGLQVTIADNGIGMGVVSETNGSSGTGQGLSLHSTLMAVVGGRLTVESEPGQYTRVMVAIDRLPGSE